MIHTFVNTFGYLSLENFAISSKRKVRFLFEIVLLGVLLYYEQQIVGLLDAPRLLQLTTVFLASHLVANFARFFITTTYRRRHQIKIGEQDNFLLGLEALVFLFTILVTLGSIFPIYDIPFADFVMSLGVFSVAIVWGFHQYITNFFDGLRLMFSNDFKIGDYIKVADMPSGIITHVSFRAAQLRTDDGDALFVPNTTILNSEVINFSKLKYKRIAVEFVLPAAEAKRVPDLEAELRHGLEIQFDKLVKVEKMKLYVITIAASEITCRFTVSTDHYNFSTEEAVSKYVNDTVITFVYR